MTLESTTWHISLLCKSIRGPFHDEHANKVSRHSKKLYAWETGPVDDMSILLLCGECDFKVSLKYILQFVEYMLTICLYKIISDSAFIDRKIKFQIPPKSNVALKLLRNQLGSLLAHQFRGKTLSESQILWNELSLMVLGKVKVDEGTPSILIS